MAAAAEQTGGPHSTRWAEPLEVSKRKAAAARAAAAAALAAPPPMRCRTDAELAAADRAAEDAVPLYGETNQLCGLWAERAAGWVAAGGGGRRAVVLDLGCGRGATLAAVGARLLGASPMGAVPGGGKRLAERDGRPRLVGLDRCARRLAAAGARLQGQGSRRRCCHSAAPPFHLLT